MKFQKNPLEVHYLGYYIKWIPQETFYYSVENCGFRPRPFRTQALIVNIIALMIKWMTCIFTLCL